ncbi:hypothetical protein B9Z65_621 [Elsinoe australis]|uniref:SET domain-containing protein n=1 Tax=Elsinoe australis TaxID=40998 RepID=A0A2P8AJ38_9PEZI|nr:hypothetical protein B9Z65_621 [Elsinoe australis]
MINEGKQEGWLKLPAEALQPWAALNNVKLHDVRVGVDSEHPERGAGVFAQRDMESSEDGHTVLMTVPRDLILSKERVEEHAKVDKDFRAILDSLESPRISILAFLLSQTYLLHPSPPSPHFVHTPLTTYLRLLPLESLPTFWTTPERSLLIGSTLLPALTAKLSSLFREYTTFRDALSSSIPWTAADWFGEIDGLVDFNDWLCLDAMYRSRALEFPGIGDCMAPCIDMANHASGEATNAIYEVDSEGNAVLVLREGMQVAQGEEVTITYGDEKGACEMLFSYGFLEGGLNGARELFLDLGTMEDDPLAKAKRVVAGTAPGVKIVEIGEDGVRWEGEWVWLVVVNEEDGLEFMVQRTTEGEEELKAFWKGGELSNALELKQKLEKEEMWDVFRLRAVSLLQDRVAGQLQELYGSDEEVGAVPHGEDTEVRDRIRGLALKLRELEGQLLEKAYACFEEEKDRLIASDAVVKYLAAMNLNEGEETTAPEASTTEEEEDFS